MTVLMKVVWSGSCDLIPLLGDPWWWDGDALSSMGVTLWIAMHNASRHKPKTQTYSHSKK